MVIRPVILCGGSGTRLWPLSTPERPKQFQSLTAAETMITLTSSRLKSNHGHGLNIGPTLIVGSQGHEKLLRQQVPEADLILEPFGRNSAPAVAAACLFCDPDDLVLILPADHHIENPQAFLTAIGEAQTAATDGSIVTFGIQPTHPATGYGYIKAKPGDAAVRDVLSFVEKPDITTAQSYIDSGHYFWNAGIFLFKASMMLTAFETHAPEILKIMRELHEASAGKVWNLEPKRFGQVEDISIDYAIMERETNIKVVPVDMGWSDVGDYQALWEMYADEPSANVLNGPAIVEDSTGLFVRSEGPVICVSGLDNFVIVAKPDIVMITPRGNAMAVKSLGAAAQTQIQSLTVSSATSAGAKTLLWSAFDKWSHLAWDKEHGGFVECLSMDGVPDQQADRRVRVQARQVFSFARAITLGWANGEIAPDLIENGLNYLNTICKHADGGWVHRVDYNGDVLDPKRDLYDHAFIMMAGAAAFEATGEDGALAMAEEALAYIDSALTDHQHGGYFESEPRTGLRRANPHMHLLEAFLTLHGATSDAAYLDRATQIVDLFEAEFFSPRENILREYFKDDWTPAEGDKGHLFEPGHHYEWATLLAQHDLLTGRDTGSWRRRLIQTADIDGTDKVSGLAHNVALPGGPPLDDKRRIWHQLEMFRARLWHPETAAPGESDRIFSTISEVYFKAMPEGLWLDETDASGNPTSDAIPASILYHLVTALTPALKP
ncbi:MAG: AGE family epimerase/isomerase [Henriciella sp.]|nr:AGE family epimerase/isomerase [Henriciella sp.]